MISHRYLDCRHPQCTDHRTRQGRRPLKMGNVLEQIFTDTRYSNYIEFMKSQEQKNCNITVVVTVATVPPCEEEDEEDEKFHISLISQQYRSGSGT